MKMWWENAWEASADLAILPCSCRRLSAFSCLWAFPYCCISRTTFSRVMIFNKRAKSDKSAELQEKDAEIERLRALVEKQGIQEGSEQKEGQQEETQPPQSESGTISEKKGE